MTSLMVGNPAVFALESSITQVSNILGQFALGFFNIHVAGARYGVNSPDATMLGCSLNEVERRLNGRGTHIFLPGLEQDAITIADACIGAMYEEGRQTDIFFGLSAEGFRELLSSRNIVWAPDGDEAFDDCSVVLQIDQAERVRLIAFKNFVDREDVARTLSEIWLDEDEFYNMLKTWVASFRAQREATLAKVE